MYSVVIKVGGIKPSKSRKVRKGGRDFLKRHKPLSSRELGENLRKMEQAKQEFTTDAAELDQNIKNFNLQSDVLVDPVSGKALCYVRRPTQEELEKMIPEELLKYQFADDVPIDIQKKYADHQFYMMEQLINKPKHDAAHWKKNSNLVFQQLFQLHLVEIYKKLGLLIENF